MNQDDAFLSLLRTSEEWLIDRILHYAKERGYSRYTSTLREAWRQSIAGLSAALCAALEASTTPPEFGPHDDAAADPIAAFGVLEAQRHRSRGVTLTMFLGLMKYYRQAYLDLVDRAGFAADDDARHRYWVGRFFDRIEVAFCSEWADHPADDHLDRLQQASREITNEKNKYLTLFESLPDPAFLVGADSNIDSMNHAAEVCFFGAGAPGRAYYAGQTAQTFEPLASEISEFASSFEPERSFERELVTNAGPRRFMVRFHRMLDVSEKFRGMTVLLADVTELRRTQEERARIERRMLEAQRLESLGILAGGIAHDFNNLLASILGNASLCALDVDPGSAIVTHVREIELASLRAAELTQQMLAYAGKGRQVAEVLDFGELVVETARLIRASVPTGVELAFQLDGDVPPLKADKTQMRQMVMSLLTNAVESMEGRAGAVSVSIGAVDITDGRVANNVLDTALEPGRYVALEIRDAGCGMDAPTQRRIFDPFFTTKFLGRGLGLAAALGVVRSHRGAISVETEPERGSVFRVYLPATTASRAERRVRSVETDAAWRGRGTVLVIDDDSSVRDVARGILERVGFTVLTAASGAEGIEHFSRSASAISLVLLDATMPRMCGAEVLRRLRALGADVPVVMASGYEEADATRDVALELAGFIRKPFGYAALVAKVRQALEPDDRRSGGGPAAT